MRKRVRPISDVFQSPDLDNDDNDTQIEIKTPEFIQKNHRGSFQVVSDPSKFTHKQSAENIDLSLFNDEPKDGSTEYLDPIKKNGWIKFSLNVDRQIPICKDYMETGYCTFGSTCKFLHTRDKMIPTDRLERQFAKEKFEKSMISTQSTTDEDLKICKICRKNFQNPVKMRCNHLLCGECAFQRYINDKTCPVCGKDTEGVFNRVKNNDMA